MTEENTREESRGEIDIRVNILDTLLTCPHRKVNDIIEVHKTMDEQDPIFYAHLGAWAQKNTAVRDHKEVFIAKMFLSEFAANREAAYVILQSIPPYQVNNVIDHIKGRSVTSRNGKIYEERFGKNLPRTFKSAVKQYLRTREADRDWFDSAALRDRSALKSIYCRCRVSPGNTHIRAVVFGDGEPDKGSKFAKFKAIGKEIDSVKQAGMIVEAGIPYTTAVGMVKEVTPAVLIALINNMTSQELLVNLNNIKERGALNDPDVKNLVKQKIQAAKQDKKVDVLKASQVVKNVKGLDDDIKLSFQEITDKLLQKTKITRKTALLIDKSASMSQAIEASKYIGTLISACCESDFYCYAFDRAAIRVNCNSPNFSDWEKATEGIRANGGTAIGAPLRNMIRRNELVEQFVIVSDFSEMNDPFFAQAYQEYVDHFGVKPSITMVKVPGRWGSRHEQFMRTIALFRVESDTYTIIDGKVDYYSIPSLLNFLTRKSKFDLIQEILEYKFGNS